MKLLPKLILKQRFSNAAVISKAAAADWSNFVSCWLESCLTELHTKHIFVFFLSLLSQSSAYFFHLWINRLQSRRHFLFTNLLKKCFVNKGHNRSSHRALHECTQKIFADGLRSKRVGFLKLFVNIQLRLGQVKYWFY